MALWVLKGTRNVLITITGRGHNLRALFSKGEIEMNVYFPSLYDPLSTSPSMVCNHGATHCLW